MKAKKWWVVALLIVLALATALCYRQYHSQPLPPAGQSDTITVVDTMGRTVEIPSKVQRVACLYAFSGHVTAMLGQGEKIVAVPDGLKRDVLLNQMVPSIAHAAVPAVQESINIEELLNTRPDVVFLQKNTAVNSQEVDKLNRFAIPYLVIDFGSIEEQQNAIRIIGKVLGVEARAEDYNSFYRNCVERVEKTSSHIPEEKRVRVYHSVNEATRTDIPGSLPADWLKRTGAINVALDKPLRLVEGKYYASLEQIMLWDPDLILANEPGVAAYITGNSQWSSLKAVKNNQVYQMPIGISRWGHPGGLETPLAMLWTAKLLYPQYYSDLDMQKETHDFYKRFFNFDINESTVNQVLSGQGMRMQRGQTAQPVQ